jgi:hypothetical protein
MGSKDTGRIKTWAREHSLPAPYTGHFCSECAHFFKEFPDVGFVNKDYCNKWIKKVDPSRVACTYFAFRIGRRRRRKKSRK